MPDTRGRLLLLLSLLVGAMFFLPGINWGLPSHAVDRYLFGDRIAWTGKEILGRTPAWSDDAQRGADVAAHPILDRSKPIEVNQTDAQRAHIVLQYRLYSAQPDEMITLRALASMTPGQLKFDPKLYQYGGLWIYPVGALLKLIEHPTADLTHYLDHPEAFGRMYVVMRLYSVMWGMMGIIIVFNLGRRLFDSDILAACGCAVFATLPVVVNMSHEAKPHLAGAVLTLAAVWAASLYVARGEVRWALLAGALCGAAGGMVLSALTSFCLLPVIVIYSPRDMRVWRVLLVSVLAGLLIYACSNPYVIVHLLGDRSVLSSNLSNSTAMYQAGPSVSGAVNAAYLLLAGASPLVVAFAIALVFHASRRPHPLIVLLLTVSAPVLVQFFALATNKPGEYGRFAILPDIVLALLALRVISRTPMGVRCALAAVLIASTVACGIPYIRGFMRDAGPMPSRLVAAQRIEQTRLGGGRTLAVDAEPAPYCLPPVNLFEWDIVLAPRGEAVSADLHVRPIDGLTPISWANKTFTLR